MVRLSTIWLLMLWYIVSSTLAICPRTHRRASTDLFTQPKPTGKAPLRTKLSNYAPRSAKIVSRNFSGAALAPTYDLKVGEVDIPNVSLDEIFDFVSHRDYEIFENTLFAREIQEADRQQLEETLLSQKLAFANLKSKKNKNPVHTSSENTDDATGPDSSADEFPQLLQQEPVEIGRHGRPRPTYGQFYLQRGGGRGRRGRPRGSGLTRAEFKQRKVSDRGGSRATPSSAKEHRIEAAESTSDAISSEPLKRRKLDATSASPARSSIRARTPVKPDPASSPDVLSPPDRVVITPKKPTYLQAPTSATKTLSNSASKRRSLAALPPDPALTSAADDDDDEEEDDASSIVSTSSSLSSEAYNLFLTSKRKGPQRPPAHPGPSSSSDHRISVEAAEDSSPDSDEDSEDSSFEIEAILEHRLSDPSTHPENVGRKPVMLYHVKWVGYEELTWEPATSFGDQRVVMQYWAKVKEEEEDDGEGDAVVVAKGKARA